MKIDIDNENDIFLVDDDLQFHFLIKKHYQKNCGIPNNLVCFERGEDCIEKLNELRENPSDFPAVILMDINMPTMDGFECVEKIRGIKECKEQPFIAMLSSSNYEKDISHSIEVGANKYIEKPFNIKNIEFVRTDM